MARQRARGCPDFADFILLAFLLPDTCGNFNKGMYMILEHLGILQMSGGGDGGGVGDDGGDGLRLWLPDGEGRRRVEESEVSGWLDRLTRSILDVAGKIPPEKFSGGGAVAAAVAG
ncbi:hypothetical protein Tco_1226049 [Tanacetum coccineum]